MDRKATAIWNGSIKEGSGVVTTQSNILNNTPYSFVSRFENGDGTNPEELIGAAHAGCFAMQLSAFLTQEGSAPEELNAECTVTLEDGTVTKSHIVLKAKVDGIDDSKFGELVKKAEKNCPISKLLNTEISVEYTLN